MASVRDIKIDEALSCYALLTMLWNKFDIAEIEMLWLSRIETLGQSKLLSGFWSWSDPSEDAGGSHYGIISLYVLHMLFSYTLLMQTCNNQGL